MALMHQRDDACDPNEEIAHIRANLDHVEQKVGN
jgi:hypothetical protein